MKPNRTLAIWSGVAGLSLIALGGWAYWRERKAAMPATGVTGFGRARLQQAPIVSSYAANGARTTLRASNDMPIEERLATIQDLVHKSVQDPMMRKVALQATSACPERDKMCEAKAIYQYVKSRVRYTGDVGPIRHPDGSVEGIDYYQSARRTLENGGGDCDDNSILVATLLALNGLTPRLRVVKTKKAPDWEHIYAGFVDTGKFVAVDTTLPGSSSFGVEAPFHKSIDFDA